MGLHEMNSFATTYKLYGSLEADKGLPKVNFMPKGNVRPIEGLLGPWDPK